jgi:hypothetical protein
MKLTSRILLAAGTLLAAGAFAAAATAFMSPTGFTGASLAFVLPLAIAGPVLLAVGIYMGKLDPSDLLERGVAGTAQIQSIQDTGVTINNVNMVVKLDLIVTIPGAPAYTAQARAMLGRMNWGALRPGMTVNVKVDPKNPSRIAIESAGSVEAPPLDAGDAPSGQTIAQAIAAAVAATGPAAFVRATGIPSLKAADVIRDGARGQGVIVSVTPSGMNAGQVTGGLAPDESDDPMVVLIFTYEDDGRSVSSQGLVRVPDGKAGFLAPGAKVPVAYLPGRNIATIDWPALT